MSKNTGNYWNTVPESHKKIYMYDYFLDKEQKVAYCINCKAACSSIMVSMLRAKNLADDYSIHLLTHNRFLSWKPFFDKNWYIYTFVRNPFERLVSCYESKYHGDRKKSIIVAQRNGKLDFDDYLDGYMKEDRGFANFVDQVVKIPTHLENPHFRCQYEWLNQNGNFIVDFIGKVEELPEAYEPIRMSYGYDPLLNYNRLEYGDWRDYYTPELAEKAYQKYKNDVLYFGYKQEYEDLLQYCEEK